MAGGVSGGDRPRRVAFLFLGETLLIPHLWPIVESLARMAPDIAIDAWIGNAGHKALLAPWAESPSPVTLRHAPGFASEGATPSKLPMLARLAPRLAAADAVVCAEQTSLWLPRLLPFLRRRFVKTSHGAGSMSARDDPRRRAAGLMLVPSDLERETYLARGFDPARVTTTGYVKSAFRHRTPARALFSDRRPILLYAPHWQRHRSSWWEWGRAIVAMLAGQDRFNVILAPHQRLAERDPDARRVLAAVARLPHIHVDLDSFAMVDGSYTAAADVYLGDTSSQVVEFVTRPRPCVFLNAQGIDRRGAEDHAFWSCGEVVDQLGMVADAIGRASAQHTLFVHVQQEFAATALGATGQIAADTAAIRIIRHIERLRATQSR